MARSRVLVLDHTGQEGGAEIALLRVCQELRERADVEILVVLFADGPIRRRLASAGVRTSVLELDPRLASAGRHRVLAGGARSAVSALWFVPRLVRSIRRSGADVVVANSLKAAVFASVAAPLAGRRWVWHLHDRLARDYLPLPLVALTRLIAVAGPSAIIVNSRATLRTLPPRARRTATIAYPGLPRGAFADETDPPPGPLLGIIGRISPTKGQHEFIEAAAIVAASRPDARFVVVGDALFGEDDYASGLHDLVTARGLDERVEFTGWVSDVAERLRRLTVLVHASPVPEPFGQVIVEAMAARVPVIAAATGGVLEILDPSGHHAPGSGWRATPTGILVHPGDPPTLAAAMSAAIADPDGRAARADAAAADAAVRFSIDRTARNVAAVWLRVAGQRHT